MDTAARTLQIDQRFPTERSRAAGAWVKRRIKTLEKEGRSVDPRAEAFSPELAVLRRIAPFRFDDYPDYTVPWHLLMWPHQRWMHVYSVIQIIECLKHAKGSAARGGGRIRLEPFQVLILLCFLGPENPDTGLRVVREGLLTLSRKNAKTTLVAGIALALMVLPTSMHGLARQELYIGACDRPQASIMFDIINKYVGADDRLGMVDIFRVVPSRKHMTHRETLTELAVLSSDSYRAHGLNPCVVVIDELGNIPENQANEFYSVLTSGFGAQDEPLTLLLSTQAAVDTHLFSGMVDRCKKLNSQDEVDNAVAGFVFETPETVGKDKLDPYDEQWWYLSNPGIGSIVSLEDMRQEAKKAAALPSIEAKFRNYRLNQRANPYNPLISKSLWQSCGGPVDYEALLGRRCTAALDLSTVNDLTCLCLAFEPDETGAMAVLPFFWAPGHAIIEKENQDKVPYRVWEKQGYIDLSSDKTISYERISERIKVCMDDFEVVAFGFDRFRIDDLKTAMRLIGLEELTEDEDRFFPIGQGYKDQPFCVEALEKALLEGRLAHGNNPVLTWCASNCVTVANTTGLRKFEKSKSYGRIDGIVAMSMALRVHELLANKALGPSSFESDACLM